MPRGVTGHAFSQESVKAVVGQLVDGRPDGRSRDPLAQHAMTDVDEVGSAERLGDAVIDRTQPMVFGDQRTQLIDVGDPDSSAQAAATSADGVK